MDYDRYLVIAAVGSILVQWLKLLRSVKFRSYLDEKTAQG